MIRTPEFKAAWPALFQPRPNKFKNNEKFYQVTALFSKDADLNELKQSAAAALKEKFGEDQTKWPDRSKFNSPFKKQDDLIAKKGNDDGHYEEGALFLRLESRNRPAVVDQKVVAIMNPSDFYAGCYARASVHVFCYKHDSGNWGYKFQLLNVQFLRDGKAFGIRTKPEDDFEAVQVPAGSTQAGFAPDEMLF